ncbi:the AP superfamily [Candidatus Scalindua japonica]|uniref:The AP superfamily n=1 Tax=Candidatus Scalindua japonica TaxID=1284222 RepID=A0A286U4D3_9BACT|nr:alkaline phosphatase family protein [Candidatus Scalindua japonica]GAX62921.1 the AP superfamily [Candidatus Scalindua japonica]
MSTILLLLDAFRCDYLSKETTPFLWKCAHEGEHYERVVQSLGFCERTEILTGMRGDESGFFTAIGFDTLNSPYATAKGLSFLHFAEQVVLFLLKFVPQTFGNKIQKRLRSYVQWYFRQQGIIMPSFLIPFTWLRYFALTEDRMDLRWTNAFSRPSIFTLLTEAGKTYFYDSFTALGLATPYASDQERLDAVVRDLGEGKKDLYLVYVSIPDTYGHLYGPESIEFRTILLDMDQMLEQFVGQAEAASSKNRFLFVGDHGMLTVTERFNAESEIENILHSARLKKGKDVLYFLDSTMVRLWAMNDMARKTLPGLLQNVSGFSAYGTWMDVGTAECYHVPWPDRRYGDHLWLANPGVLVFPDFFHRIAPCKGMHGYNPHIQKSQGVCIRWGEGVALKTYPTLPLSTVFELLRQSVGV